MANRKGGKRSLSVSSHSDSDDQNDSRPKKQKGETVTKATISDVEFKFLLRDQATVTEGLQKFLQTAEALSDGVPCDDVIAGYCRSSPSCAELFALLDPAINQLKMNDITLVFQCLEQILTRIRTDLLKLSSTGEAIVQRILAAHMGQLYTCLRDQNKSKTIKTALQLLIAMTMQSEKAKKAVLSRLNFGHQNFPALFRRRNRKDPQDVRSCLVLLTMAFLLDSDNSIVNTLVQQKTFLQMTIAGLKFDSKETVVDVLSTLLDKVVRCPGLTKTSKIKLFSENLLKQLCELYHWLGPTEWKAGGKKWKDKGEEEVQIRNEALVDDQEEIADIVQKFLLELCCSHKYGINFYDKSLGTGTRNQNQLLGHLLLWLVKKINEPHTAELILAILCACPDQIKPVLTVLCPLLAPRWSDKWADLMDWLKKLYSKLPDIPAFLANPESQRADETITVSMTTIFCLPPQKISAILTQSLKHDDLRVRHRCLIFVRVLARKAFLLLQVFADREESGFKLADGTGRESLTAYIMKTLPPMSHLFVCVDKVMHRLSVGEETGMEKEMITEEEMDIDLSTHVVLLLQVLTLYQKLCPTLLSDRPKDLVRLIDMVGKLQTQASSEEDNEEEEEGVQTQDGEDDKWLPQLYLMKLLSEADARKISLGREGLLEKLLVSASQRGCYKDLTVSLVSKMLQGINVFNGHERELEIWLNDALNRSTKSDKDTSTSVISTQTEIHFLSRCLCSLINNPTPFLDRLMEILADAATSTHPVGVEAETSSVGTNESAINAILLMEDEELDSLLEASKPSSSGSKSHSLHLPFSPLTLAALDGLHYCKTDKVRIQKFVSQVLVDLLHTLPSQSSLAFVVKKSEAKMCEGVREYLEFWATHRLPGKGKLSPLPSLICGAFTSQMSALYLADTDVERKKGLDLVTREIAGMETGEWQPGFGHVLLYLAEVARKAESNPGSKKLLAALIKSAECLIDDLILRDQKEEGKIKSSTKETKQLSLKEEDTEAFSDFLSDNENFRNKFANTIRFTLLNPTLLSLLSPSPPCLFIKKKKKMPQKEKRQTEPGEDISCQISEFVCYILEKCKTFKWIQEDKKIIEKHLEISLEKLSAADTLSPQHEEVCIRTVNILCPWLDLISLSRCITKLLQFPYSKLIISSSPSSKSNPGIVQHPDQKNRTTPLCETLISLLNHLSLKVAEGASKSGIIQMSGISEEDEIPRNYNISHSLLTRNQFEGKKVQFIAGGGSTSADEGQRKGCVKIQTSFRLEEQTKLKLSDLSSFFDLLASCHLPHLESCAISLLTYIPGVISATGELLPNMLFSAPLNIQSSSRQHIAVILLQNQKESFHRADSWLEKNAQKAVKKGTWWLIRSYLQARNKFDTESKTTVMALKKLLPPLVKKILEDGEEDELICLKLLSQAVGQDDFSFQQLVTDSVCGYIKKLKEVQTLHYEILLVSSKFCESPNINTKGEAPQRPETVVMDLIQSHLSHLASKKKRSEKMETFLLDLALSLTNNWCSSDFKNLDLHWVSFVKNTLRHLYTNAKLLRLLTFFVPAVYPLRFPHGQTPPSSADGETYLSAKTIFQLCVSHTAFMEVMMTPDHTLAKDELVNLLKSLGDVDDSCYQPQLSKVLVGAYGATLSKTDQILLLMMEKCSQDSDGKFECPSLWGKSALDHYTVSQVLGPSLDRQASLKAVLEQLDPARLQDSIINFPVRRGQKTDQIADANEFKSKPECYDPSFLLRFFGQVLLPDKLVPLRLFVEHGCLGYLLVALSSHDLKSRLLAYQALNDFYTHAEGSRWQERLELNFVLDLLNASRVKDGQKLPFVVALFFSRVVKLILYPADPLYMPIFRFLVARPEMDLANVPEFYQLFFSSGVQHKQERNWMLSLLRDGLRETSDYWLYQRRLIFKIVLAFYDSALSDVHSQDLVLQIVRNGCKEKSVAVDLVKNHGLLSWLSAVVAGLAKRPNHIDLVCDIVHCLWSSLTTSKYQNLSNQTANISSDDKAPGITDFATKMEVNMDSTELQSEEEDSEESTSEDELKMDVDQGKKTSLINDVKNTSTKMKKSLSVPKSTLVEMSLIVKSLIWHLNKSSAASLDKILQTLHSMLQYTESPDAHRFSHSQSNLSIGTPSTGQNTEQAVTSHQAQNLLSLSPIESCLLLYHVAKAMRQEITAKQAQDMLMSRGLNVEWLARAHKGKFDSVRETIMAGADNSAADESVSREVTDMDEMEEEGDSGEKVDGDGVVHSVDEREREKVGETDEFNAAQRRNLFNSLCSVVRLTGTLQFV